MITFACKKIKQEELIRCSFNLNKTEYNLLVFILRDKKGYTVSQIAKRTRLERTTVQKAVKNLVSKQLAQRKQKNLAKGGYVFVYKPNDKSEIKAKMRKIVYNWYQGVKKEIAKL